MSQQSSDPSPPISPRHVTVVNIEWRRILEFTQLFRAFRLAINPAKISLVILAIVLIYGAGRVFDFAWGPQVYADEIISYQGLPAKAYQQLREVRLQGRESNMDLMLREASDNSPTALTPEQREVLKVSPRAAYRVLKAASIRQYHKALADLAQQRQIAEKDLASNPFVVQQSTTPAQAEQEGRQAAAKSLYMDIKHVQSTIGTGIFDAFVTREIGLFDALVHNTLTCLRVIPAAQPQRVDLQVPGQAISSSLLTRNSESLNQSDTIVASLYNMAVTTPMWLVSATAPMQYRPENANSMSGRLKIITYRGVYLVSLFLLVVFAIVILAFTGASIARLSALELAGIERAPLMEVFRFAVARLWAFIKAILTPFLIILIVGLFITALSLIGAVPYIGEIILGVFFIALLLIAFVIMLLIFGIVGGINLFFPTIAVEGSDAFDAMSRSFAYVYARPWRLIFYNIISLIYGVITYLFVSFAVYLIFLITHIFAGWGASFFGCANGRFSGSLKLDTLWPLPKFAPDSGLLSGTNWYAMNWSETIGSACMHVWMYLFVFAVAGYVISYYFSVNTIVYLLLRRSVDGQPTTEVFQAPPQPAPQAAPTPTPAPTATPTP
ncbi:MAG: hypothetical protein FWD61_18025 [Phycisphaerales bacterium]|nr:hypothetical protein [Phycisphaerales bacterium]